MLHRLAIFFGLLALLGACAERGEGPLLSSGDRYAQSTDVLSDYRLGAGDRVKVTILNLGVEQEQQMLEADFVDDLLQIAYARMAREVEIMELRSKIATEAQSRYGQGYLRDPKVSMEVIVFRPFYILGEVEQPGQYPFAAGMTALNAIATAKGFTPRAARDTVRIRRQGAASEENYRLTPELQIYPGDTIRIGERFF